ncbi:MAG: hypothetical protein ACXVY6_04080 [Gaiellaceae bacterium]
MPAGSDSYVPTRRTICVQRTLAEQLAARYCVRSSNIGGNPIAHQSQTCYELSQQVSL